MNLELDIHGRRRQIEIGPGDSSGAWVVRIDGKPVEADAHLIRPGVLSLLIEGKSYRVVLDAGPVETALHLASRRIPYRLEDTRSLRGRRHAGGDGPITLKTSMPGRVVRVLVEEGDTVAAHQGVLVIEAMKMQNEMKSPREGRVVEVRVSPGDTVAAGDILAVIE